MENQDFEIVPVGTKELIQELAKHIPGTIVTRDVGSCTCGNSTSSGVYKVCPKCLREKVNRLLGG